MGEIARWNDASLVPERGLTLSPTTDAKLRDHIQSLLVSHHQVKSSEASWPSRAHTNQNRKEHRFQNHPRPKTLYNSALVKGEAQSIQPENRVLDMGATRFDGPAGQIDDTSDVINGRRPSQRDVPAEINQSGDWTWSTRTSGLNQRAHGDVVGREASVPTYMDRTKPQEPRKSTQSRLPRYHLRTVAPATNVNEVFRPNPQHVPGSYRSEVDRSRGRNPSTPSVAAKNALETSEDGVLAVPYHTDVRNNEHSHPAAVDTLMAVVKHDSHLHEQPALSTNAASSYKAQRFNDAVGTLQKPQQGALPDDTACDQVLDHAPSVPHKAKDTTPRESERSLFVIGDDQDEDFNPFDRITEQQNDTGFAEKAPLLNGPQISELLDKLPPVKRTIAKTVDESRRSSKTSANKESVKRSRRSSLVPDLYSSIKNKDGNMMNSASSYQKNDKAVDVSSKLTADHDDAAMPLVSDSRRSSQAVARISPITRAMSMLSDLSARSGIKTPSLHSSTGYEKLGSDSNLTARPSSRSRQKTLEASPANEAHGDITQYTQRGANGDGKDSPILQSQQKNGQGFTKVITDLESVLTEALNIAGQTAHLENDQTRLLSSHVRRRGYSRANSDPSTGSSEFLSSLSGVEDEENNNTTLPRVNDRTSMKNPQNDDQLEGSRETRQYQIQARDTMTVPVSNNLGSRLSHRSTNPDFLEIPRKSSKAFRAKGVPSHQQQTSTSTDWAAIRVPSRPSKLRLEIEPPPPEPRTPLSIRVPAKEQHTFLVRERGNSEDTTTRLQIRDYVNTHQRPPVQPRLSSRRLNTKAKPGRKPKREELNLPDEIVDDGAETDCDCVPYTADFETSGLNYHPVFQDAMDNHPAQAPRPGHRPFRPPQDTITPLHDDPREREASRHDEPPPATNTYSLEGRHHFSIREPRGFSLSRSHRRSPIARDWSKSRKRYTATVVCVTTAFVGLIIGIYAGEVPAIQYAIADEHHYTILGNVLFYIGMAISTALFYPLPLLHGRKPYTLGALAILLPLQFPQALAIDMSRSPYVATYRVGLLVPRVFAGLVMGFANINFITTLLDLYGASLQSGNPHQEVVNENDVRRHGGGMGMWLSIWTWCFIGSLGLGFLIGAGIISGLNVSWGYWILIILNAAVLLLNIVTPEVRRSAYRRSMAEVRNGGEVSRRVAKGEIKMHLESTGPIWWGEEVFAGHVLAIRMLMQPGFAVLALYEGWIYGQVVLVIVVSPSTCDSCSSAHFGIAAWGTPFQILLLPPSIRRPSGRDHSPRCIIGGTF